MNLLGFPKSFFPRGPCMPWAWNWLQPITAFIGLDHWSCRSRSLRVQWDSLTAPSCQKWRINYCINLSHASHRPLSPWVPQSRHCVPKFFWIRPIPYSYKPKIGRDILFICGLINLARKMTFVASFLVWTTNQFKVNYGRWQMCQHV